MLYNLKLEIVFTRATFVFQISEKLCTMNIKLLKTKFYKFYVERVYLWLGPKNGVSPSDNVVKNCTETRIYSDLFARLMKLPKRPFRAKP